MNPRLCPRPKGSGYFGHEGTEPVTKKTVTLDYDWENFKTLKEITKKCRKAKRRNDQEMQKRFCLKFPDPCGNGGCTFGFEGTEPAR